MPKLHAIIKLNLFGFLILHLLTGCADASEEPSTLDKPWNLIFEDEFDTDFSNWHIWEGGAYNQEIQLYRGGQLSLKDGLLTIETQREEATGPSLNIDSTSKKFEYVSGRIESKVAYGPSGHEGEREYRFEARIKLPNGHGMWPAFWTYGDPWPTQGEIDILEARGSKPLEFQSNLFYGTQPGVNINQDTEVVHEMNQDLTNAFHVYEMIWTSNSIDILFDGELLHTYEANQNNNIHRFFEKKQKVVLNTAVGGWFFTDNNSKNFADTAYMEVDWVKVYKR